MSVIDISVHIAPLFHFGNSTKDIAQLQTRLILNQPSLYFNPSHLMERGVNIRYIQSALGHSSSKTTEIYTRVTSINNKTLRSPLDSLYDSAKFGDDSSGART